MRALAVVAALSMAASLGCKAQKDAFYNQTFTCTPSATQDGCGTTRDGKPMTCFVGSALGGEDFCAEACDPAHGSDDPDFTCVASGKWGALLRNCQPAASAQDPSLGCPAPLQCYRTDVLQDQGLCLDMSVCATNADCPGDTRRTVCASTILSALLPTATADHLQCVQPTCTSGGTLCSSGELCLADFYNTGLAPDICVPACDPYLHCPPNFSCAAASSGGAPAICVPGVPGTRCQSDQDCVIGTCFDTGAGFSECVPPLPCASALDCAALDRPAFFFVCGQAPQTGERRCLGLGAFHGANCNETADCPDGQMCYRFSPYTANQGHGECRLPCDGDLHCPTIAGVGHTCLDGGDGGCYPGDFALGCTRQEDCLADFSCLPASRDDQHTRVTSPNICTITCGNDADCRTDPLIGMSGFCMEGICRLAGDLGDPCTDDDHCRSGRQCVFDAAGLGTCSD
ncbi:MAG TPA: hypothetical protein VIF57_32310 [Polyangia bacterium]|jgi:hypothetical protein